MQDLQLVGVHDDGEHLLLTTADGHHYRLPIDEPLRAAVRRDRARLGQLQITMDGALRPKEIQARIRAGESAEDITAASGLPLEHVRRYEGAVLAEREHVAALARAVTVRRRQGDAPSLEQVVIERLSAREAAAAREWDAWRREDGTWTVQLAFRTGSKDRMAHWRFDALTSAVEPLDDEARWLSAQTDGEEGPVGGRRLSAVKERVYDVEADGGVREQPGGGADEPSGERERRRTVDLLETLRSKRGRRQPVARPDDATEGQSLLDEVLADAHLGDHLADGLGDGLDADLPTGGLLDEAELAAAMRASEAEAPAAHPPASRPQDATDAHILALPGPVPDVDPEPPVAAEPVEGEPVEGEPVDEAEPEPVPRVRGRPKRATVPSWDDIVFGARRD